MAIHMDEEDDVLVNSETESSEDDEEREREEFESFSNTLRHNFWLDTFDEVLNMADRAMGSDVDLDTIILPCYIMRHVVNEIVANPLQKRQIVSDALGDVVDRLNGCLDIFEDVLTKMRIEIGIIESFSHTLIRKLDAVALTLVKIDKMISDFMCVRVKLSGVSFIKKRPRNPYDSHTVRIKVHEDHTEQALFVLCLCGQIWWPCVAMIAIRLDELFQEVSRKQYWDVRSRLYRMKMSVVNALQLLSIFAPDAINSGHAIELMINPEYGEIVLWGDALRKVQKLLERLRIERG